jgi:hypothetical protein
MFTLIGKVNRCLFILPILGGLGFRLHSTHFQTVETVFVPQSGTPVGIPNFVDPNRACNWMGIAGQIFDLNDEPMIGLVVRVVGTLEGNSFVVYGVTGGASKIGPGGYILQISDRPINSFDSVFLQVLDIGGNPITPRIQINTYDSCEKNLIIANVIETANQHSLFLPLIKK